MPPLTIVAISKPSATTCTIFPGKELPSYSTITKSSFSKVILSSSEEALYQLESSLAYFFIFFRLILFHFHFFLSFPFSCSFLFQPFHFIFLVHLFLETQLAKFPKHYNGYFFFFGFFLSTGRQKIYFLNGEGMFDYPVIAVS